MKILLKKILKQKMTISSMKTIRTKIILVVHDMNKGIRLSDRKIIKTTEFEKEEATTMITKNLKIINLYPTSLKMILNYTSPFRLL